MKTVKQVCALLLAFVLVMSIALQPGIGAVFAVEIEEEPQAGNLTLEEEPDEVAPPVEEESPNGTNQNGGAPGAQPQSPSGNLPEAEPEEYPWGGLETDWDFVNWLTLEKNAEIIKGILSGERNETRDALERRIQAVLAEADAGLAAKAEACLTKLLRDFPDTLARLGIVPREPEKAINWEELSDEEFAVWLMTEENAQTVKEILSDEEDERYASLYARIDRILDGGDEELAEAVNLYLSELVGPTPDDAMALGDSDYIYFDLALGDVTISNGTYSGKVWAAGKETTVTGSHSESNHYYIYQSTNSNRAQTGYETLDKFNQKQECRVPEYAEVKIGEQSWSSYITGSESGYADPEDVRRNWPEAAKAVGRTADSLHKISVTNASGKNISFVLDNVWAEWQELFGWKEDTATERAKYTASISINQKSTVTMELKGDNRLGNIWSISNDGKSSRFIITSWAGDKHADGSLTLTNTKDTTSSSNNFALIGGGSSATGKLSLEIRGGTIYAGMPKYDAGFGIVLHCIGGRKESYVDINGGILTAISNSTAAAIGGGGGLNVKGGTAEVKITDGNVYAFNNSFYSKSNSIEVPCTAIGGSSSVKKMADSVSVTISGGTVYAKSIGGTAIGGGGSAWCSGGSASVTITGGTVEAYSIAGTVGTKEVTPGIAIGGGVGGIKTDDEGSNKGKPANGGSATINISGGTVTTGSIGGGKKNNPSGKIGYANVTISGNSSIQAQFMMAAGGMKSCTFAMSGGIIHDVDAASSSLFLEKNGGALWMDDPGAVVTITGGTITRCKAVKGGAVYMTDGTFKMSGGTIYGNSASDNGGAIDLHGGTVNISGGNVQYNTAEKNGGGVFVYGGSFQMTGGVIRSNTATGPVPDEENRATGNGGGIDLHSGTVTISGGIVKDNTAKKNGGGVFVYGGTFTMSGTADISENHAIGEVKVLHAGDNTGCGGGIDVHQGKAFIYGGTVNSNEATHNGGGVFIAEGVLTINNGTVSGNTAQGNGGGIDIHGSDDTETDGVVTISGGEIKNNTANQNGGGVFVYEGKLTMTGGTISDNKATGANGTDKDNHATGNGGGIDLHAGTVSISGGNVQKNTAKKNGGGVFVFGGTFTMDKTGAVETVISGNQATGEVSVVNPVDNTGCGGGIDVHNGSAIINGGKVESNKAAHNGGGIFIAEGILTMNSGTVSGNTAQGNGGGIDIHGNENSPDDGIVTIHDGEIKGNIANKNGGGVFIYAGKLDMTNGSISGNHAGESDVTGETGTIGNGGGIDLHAGEVNISGGSVDQNTATDHGGGVYVFNGTFNMTGNASITNNTAEVNGGGIDVHFGDAVIDGAACLIQGNTAKKNGGGVYVAQGEFDLYSGRIHKNTALGNGGGIDIHGKESTSGKSSVAENEGKVTIHGGTVDENIAQKNGGGVFVYGGSFEMTGGMICKNKAEGTGGFDEEGKSTGNGGGIDLHAGEVIISGGIVELNTAGKNGGGVFVYDGTFNMSGTALISENEALGTVDVVHQGDNTGFGGGIDVHEGTVVIGGGRVENNKAHLSGGGIFVFGGNVIITDGTIYKNRALGEKDAMDYKGQLVKTGSGGGIDIHSGNVTMTGGSVEENTAQLNGGGVYVFTGDFTLNGGEIIKNATVEGNGGGIDVHEGQALIRGGTVEGNHAAINGGGVFIFSGKFYLSSGSIIHNTASANGGGIDVHEGNVFIYGGTVETNHAQDGAGIYLYKGDLLLCGENASIVRNVASQSGGGVFIYDGGIEMYSGSIEHNTANLDGGGMYVYPIHNEVVVHLYSGSISHNTANRNGGGIALNSTSDTSVTVVVGINEKHPNLDLTTRSFTPFPYPDSNVQCLTFTEEKHVPCPKIESGTKHLHAACPQIENNTSGGQGGGFYLSGEQTTLTFYCVHEKGSAAPDEQCNGMYVEGGQVNFGAQENNNVNILTESTILVVGGSMDVYGNMTNPRFTEKVTVNITEPGYHYYDRRTYDNGTTNHYKVHYYENFSETGSGTATGLYIAKQYPDPDKENTGEQYDVEILPFLFTHPGYKIIGWCTNKNPAVKDPNNPAKGDTWYQVYQTYQLNKLDKSKGMGATKYPETETLDPNLLVIYAIWERCGYVLQFLPNVPDGSPYSGTMADLRVTVGLLDGSQKLPANAYKRNGYVFAGWTLEPEGTEPVYKDQYAIMADFTKEDGAIIQLYAQWAPCTHIDYLKYSVTDNVITQTCENCGNHTAKMTLTAMDADYDGHEHLAFAEYDLRWLGDKPAIAYTMASSDWDSKDDVAEEWERDKKPIHAGTYTASVTVGEGVTATKAYEIRPVKWPTPATPKVQLQAEADDHVKVIITEPTGDHLVYAMSMTNAPENVEWSGNKEFNGLTYNSYYYFFAAKEATRDHLQSQVSSSEAYLYTGGNMVIIQSDVGIVATPSEVGTGSYHLTVTTADGYHYFNYHADLTAEELRDGEGETVSGASGKEKVKLVEDTVGLTGEKNYHVEGLNEAKFCVITIRLTGAAKDCSVEAKATDGQVFMDFTGKPVTISRDSAFTASFTVNDLIPAEYEIPALEFNQNFPIGTTVILKTNGSYWHYRVTAATKTIALTGFTAMGGDASFACDTTKTAVAAPFTCQFVVDFSQTDTHPAGEDLDVRLKLTHKADTNAPDPQTHLQIGLKDVAQFAMTAAVQGKTAALNCTYTPSNGAASIWNGRRTALVLTPAQGTAVPSDLTLTTVVGDQTTVHSLNNQRQFIVPLSSLPNQDITHSITLSLHSASFKKESVNLGFIAEWVVSPSSSAEAPMIKCVMATQNLSFTCAVDAVPSVRIDGTQRVRVAGETLRVNVMSKGIPAGGSLTASLQRKQADKSYTDTGVWQNVKVNVENGESISFNVGAMPPGSYRILATVSYNGGHLLQVSYYFLIAAS